MSRDTTRLHPQDWLDAGQAALATDGPDALRAEPLARKLGVTKGSFYWHFTDVSDFHAVFLKAWVDQSISQVTEALNQEHTPVAKLRRLAQIIAGNPEQQSEKNAEPVIRAWAKANSSARQSVARLDYMRLTYMQDLLAQTGIGNPEMSRIIFAAGVGMTEMQETDEDNSSAMGSLVDLVLALR